MLAPAGWRPTKPARAFDDAIVVSAGGVLRRAGGAMLLADVGQSMTHVRPARVSKITRQARVPFMPGAAVSPRASAWAVRTLPGET